MAGDAGVFQGCCLSQPADDDVSADEMRRREASLAAIRGDYERLLQEQQVNILANSFWVQDTVNIPSPELAMSYLTGNPQLHVIQK